MATVFSLHEWDVLFVDGIILESLCPPRFSSYSREKNQQDPNVQRFPHLAGGRLNRVQCYQSRLSWITYKGFVIQCVKSTKCCLVTIFDMDKGEKKSSFVCLFYQLGKIPQLSQEVGVFWCHGDGIQRPDCTMGSWVSLPQDTR